MKAELLREIDAMLEDLGGPLSLQNQRGGWSAGSLQAMTEYYGRMRDEVLSGVDVSKINHYKSTVRGLDHWGINGGQLFERAARICAIVSALKLD